MRRFKISECSAWALRALRERAGIEREGGSTRRSVAAAEETAVIVREGVEAERSSMEAMAMPYIIAVPRQNAQAVRRAQMQTDGADWTLRPSLWNLGSGPGIVTSIRLRTSEADELLVPLWRSIPIAPGDQFAAEVGIADWPQSLRSGKLTIEYLHSNGRSYRTESQVTIDGGELRCLTFRRSAVEEADGTGV